MSEARWYRTLISGIIKSVHDAIQDGMPVSITKFVLKSIIRLQDDVAYAYNRLVKSTRKVNRRK